MKRRFTPFWPRVPTTTSSGDGRERMAFRISSTGDPLFREQVAGTLNCLAASASRSSGAVPGQT